MFTGLIEEVGSVLAVEQNADGSRITVTACAVLEDAGMGDSIAIDGVCTTVIDLTPKSFTIEASPETLSKTNFKQFAPGRRVNLERPLTSTSRIGGHYVTGHVDGLARVISRESVGNSIVYTFEVESQELSELLIPKGSVAVLGISLTVNAVENRCFSVAIIPHTLNHTNLDDFQPGDWVNIETDLLGKYVRKLLFERNTESTIHLDAPTLNHTMGLTQPAATGATLHTGGWFNHE